MSLRIEAGEALGIVGESGCGKSTLSRALLRLGPVTAGEIVWLGRPIQDLGGEELRTLRAGMQIVFQDPFASLDPTMRVNDIVAEPLRALRPDLDAAQRASCVAAMLTSVGLGPEYASRRSRELSGGQCQRVAIARAMILEPRLLVCDEAVSALDVSIQAQLLELFAAIKRDHGTSILFVSHNLAVVRKLCERVLVMYLGRVVEEGPTEEVFLRPRHPYTRMLLESVPLLDPALNAPAWQHSKCREKHRRRSIARADVISIRVVRPRSPCAPTAVQSRKTSRNRTRWPACGGARSPTRHGQ